MTSHIISLFFWGSHMRGTWHPKTHSEYKEYLQCQWTFHRKLQEQSFVMTFKISNKLIFMTWSLYKVLYYYQKSNFITLFGKKKRSVIRSNELGDKVLDHFQVPVPSSLHPAARAALQLYSYIVLCTGWEDRPLKKPDIKRQIKSYRDLNWKD